MKVDGYLKLAGRFSSGKDKCLLTFALIGSIILGCGGTLVSFGWGGNL